MGDRWRGFTSILDEALGESFFGIGLPRASLCLCYKLYGSIKEARAAVDKDKVLWQILHLYCLGSLTFFNHSLKVGSFNLSSWNFLPSFWPIIYFYLSSTIVRKGLSIPPFLKIVHSPFLPANRSSHVFLINRNTTEIKCTKYYPCKITT